MVVVSRAKVHKVEGHKVERSQHCCRHVAPQSSAVTALGSAQLPELINTGVQYKPVWETRYREQQYGLHFFEEGVFRTLKSC